MLIYIYVTSKRKLPMFLTVAYSYVPLYGRWGDIESKRIGRSENEAGWKEKEKLQLDNLADSNYNLTYSSILFDI